jgi:hypothetical protein
VNLDRARHNILQLEDERDSQTDSTPVPNISHTPERAYSELTRFVTAELSH